MDFYDDLADQYNEMTDLDSRAENIRGFIKRIKERYQPKSALDVACGTGMHAVVMSQMDIHAVGADLSPAMLEKAKELAHEKDVQIQWINTPMQDLPAHLDEKFDLILCLGNSIPHLLTPDDLSTTISGCAQLLNPKGALLIQLLNYHKILKAKERIVAITRSGDTEYIRFYDFLPELIQFNLLTINSQNQHKLTSTPLFPYTAATLTNSLRQHNFATINTYADLNFNRFDEDESPNLVIEAHL